MAVAGDYLLDRCAHLPRYGTPCLRAQQRRNNVLLGANILAAGFRRARNSSLVCARPAARKLRVAAQMVSSLHSLWTGRFDVRVRDDEDHSNSVSAATP